MLKKPGLKHNYHVEFMEEDKALLFSENGNAFLTGKLYCDVLRHLGKDGAAIDTLISKLEEKYSFMRILAALKRLETDGFITESVTPYPPAESAYWNSADIHTERLSTILEEKNISTEYLENPSQEGLTKDIFSEVLAQTGIKVSAKGELRVIVTDNYLRKELGQVNREALADGQPWMLVKPAGIELWIGPVFVPGRTGCYECLSHRLKNNRPLYTFFQTRRQTEELPGFPPTALPLTIRMAAGMTALEIVKWLYFGKSHRLVGNLQTFDTNSFIAQSNVLVKRPQCPVCGNEEGKSVKPPKPMVLNKSSETCITTRGGYREVPLEQTVEKYGHHISPITGVVQCLKPYYPANGAPVYNYTSGFNMALQSKSMFWLNFHLRCACGGKGRNPMQAKAGALCEAIERYSCTYQGDEYRITGSLKQLGEKAVHPNLCMNYSKTQYRDREAANEDSRKFYLWVPRPFDESIRMEWSPVYSLTGRTFKYLPSCFCYAQYPAEDERNLFSYPDTNGCAAGNTKEEAILQGFLELVERDSVALWWYNRLEKPAVDLSSFNDPYFDRLREYYRSLQRSLYVLDLTADLKIPVFGAISHRLKGKKQEIIFGFGAHVDAGIAMERALVELNQLLPIADVPGADRAKGKYRTKDDLFLHWLETATIEKTAIC